MREYAPPAGTITVVSPDPITAKLNGIPVELAPYTQITKTDIVRRGAALGIDYSQTWSCYKGGEKHCGKCGTCRERIEAFHDAGVVDHTVYEDGE